jgi:3-oxoacyl-[acyl-carrier protein] reductase
MGKLDGKIALVTGSGRNIGRATVLKLAGEGCNIVVNARSNEQEANAVAREVQDLGVKAISVLADVGKKDEVETLAAKALSAFGRVDILVNNAAIRPHKPFLEVTDEDWEHVRNVVLDGPFYLTRALIGDMAKNQYGRVLFFCGDGSITARGTGRAHLSAVKMGLIGMARGLATEFAPHVRVNVVSPGSIDTRRDHPEWYGGAGHVPNAAGIPLGRQGHVDEIAATCLFLVSDDGGFITGQTIHVNGGAAYY